MKMCHECGDSILKDPLSNMCSKCFEYYRRQFYGETDAKTQPQPITGKEKKNVNK